MSVGAVAIGDDATECELDRILPSHERDHGESRLRSKWHCSICIYLSSASSDIRSKCKGTWLKQFRHSHSRRSHSGFSDNNALLSRCARLVEGTPRLAGQRYHTFPGDEASQSSSSTGTYYFGD